MADYERMVQQLMERLAAPGREYEGAPYSSKDPETYRYRSGEVTSDVGWLDPVDMLAGMLTAQGARLATRAVSPVPGAASAPRAPLPAPPGRRRLPIVQAPDHRAPPPRLDFDMPLGTHGPPFDPQDPETSLRWFADQLRRTTDAGRRGWSRGTADITPQYLADTPLPSRPPPWPGQDAADLSGSERSLEALLDTLHRTRQGTSSSDMPDDLMEEIGLDLIQEFLKYYRRQ